MNILRVLAALTVTIGACAVPPPGGTVASMPGASPSAAAEMPTTTDTSDVSPTYVPLPDPSFSRCNASPEPTPTAPDPGEVTTFTDLRDFAFDEGESLVALDGVRLLRIHADGRRTPFGPTTWVVDGRPADPKALFRGPHDAWYVVAATSDSWRDYLLRLDARGRVVSATALAGTWGSHLHLPTGQVAFTLSRPHVRTENESPANVVKVGLYRLEAEGAGLRVRELQEMGHEVVQDGDLAYHPTLGLVFQGRGPNVSRFFREDGAVDSYGRRGVPLAFDARGLAYEEDYSDGACTFDGIRRNSFQPEMIARTDEVVVVGPGGVAFTGPPLRTGPLQVDRVKFSPAGDLDFRISRTRLGRVPAAALARVVSAGSANHP